MSDPHFHEDQVVEREVVERPVRTRTVTETRVVGGGMNAAALVLAGVLTIFIIVLIFGYLL